MKGNGLVLKNYTSGFDGRLGVGTSFLVSQICCAVVGVKEGSSDGCENSCGDVFDEFESLSSYKMARTITEISRTTIINATAMIKIHFLELFDL